MKCDYCYGDGKCPMCLNGDDDCEYCEGYDYCWQCNGTGQLAGIFYVDDTLEGKII